MKRKSEAKRTSSIQRGSRRRRLRERIASEEPIDPFSLWSSCTELLEAFIDSVVERPDGCSCDEGVASMASGLLEGTGGAVLEETLSDQPPRVVVATGTWEGVDLRRILEDVGSYWAAALSDEPMLVVRRRGGLRLRPLRGRSRSSGSAVVFPLTCSGERVGAIVVTYDAPRRYDALYLSAGKLLAGGLSMRLGSERSGERMRRQGERISRLASEVERMGVLLRRAAHPTSGET